MKTAHHTATLRFHGVAVCSIEGPVKIALLTSFVSGSTMRTRASSSPSGGGGSESPSSKRTPRDLHSNMLPPKLDEAQRRWAAKRRWRPLCLLARGRQPDASAFHLPQPTIVEASGSGNMRFISVDSRRVSGSHVRCSERTQVPPRPSSARTRPPDRGQLP